MLQSRRHVAPRNFLSSFKYAEQVVDLGKRVKVDANHEHGTELSFIVSALVSWLRALVRGQSKNNRRWIIVLIQRCRKHTNPES